MNFSLNLRPKIRLYHSVSYLHCFNLIRDDKVKPVGFEQLSTILNPLKKEKKEPKAQPKEEAKFSLKMSTFSAFYKPKLNKAEPIEKESRFREHIEFIDLKKEHELESNMFKRLIFFLDVY